MHGLPPARFLAESDKVLPGIRGVINVPAPAAASEWSVAVPGGQRWKLVGGQATLTTSATVANRNGGVQITSLGVLIYVNVNTFNVTASTNHVYVYQQGTTTNASGTIGTTNWIPTLCPWLIQGDTIGSLTGNLSAGDQYSAISLVFEQYYLTDDQLTEFAQQRIAAQEWAAEQLAQEYGMNPAGG